jgi:hypothetical protein
MLLRACLTVVLGAGSSLLAADDLELNLYTSADGKYKVLLPGEVNTMDKKLGGTVGGTNTKTASAFVGSDAAFAVSYADLMLEVPADQVRGVVSGYVKSLAGKGGKVLSSKDCTIGPDKVAGREVLIQQPKNFLRVRATIVGKRLYQVVAAGPKDFVTSKDADKVLDSFEITK